MLLKFNRCFATPGIKQCLNIPMQHAMGNHLWQKTRDSHFHCGRSKFMIQRCKTAITSRMHSGYLWQCPVCTHCHCSPPGEQMVKLCDVQLAGPFPTLPRRLRCHSQRGRGRGGGGQSSFVTFTEAAPLQPSLACCILRVEILIPIR